MTNKITPTQRILSFVAKNQSSGNVYMTAIVKMLLRNGFTSKATATSVVVDMVKAGELAVGWTDEGDPFYTLPYDYSNDPIQDAAQPETVESVAAAIATPAEMVALLGDDESAIDLDAALLKVEQSLTLNDNKGYFDMLDLLGRDTASDLYAEDLINENHLGYTYITAEGFDRLAKIKIAQVETRKLPQAPEVDPDYFADDEDLSGVEPAIVNMMQGYSQRNWRTKPIDFVHLCDALQVSFNGFNGILNGMIDSGKIRYDSMIGAYELVVPVEMTPVPVELLNELQTAILETLTNGGAWSIGGLWSELAPDYLIEDIEVAIRRLVSYGHVVETEGGLKGLVLYTLKAQDAKIAGGGGSGSKTREEVEELKRQWLFDPQWDLADSEGFEEYADELAAFQDQRTDDLNELRLRERNYKAEIWGCNPALVDYITKLELRIAQLEKAQDKE